MSLQSNLNKLKRRLELLFLSVLRKVPNRLAKHALYLMTVHTDVSDKWGYHIRPVHFYEPLPDFRMLTATQCSSRRTYPALNFALADQITLLKRLCVYRPELEELALGEPPRRLDFDNDYFAHFDAAVYYALIRDLRPARVVEIGGGYSTQVAAAALARNRIDGRASKLECIEPYPEERLLGASLDMQLLQAAVEDVPLEFFDSMQENDILFIDSSHTVTYQGDVCREFLEILPRLPKGVWVHIHDIFFPYDYPAEWVIKRRIAFNEQYLLEAFLAYNQAFRVRLGNHWLWRKFRNEVSQLWSLNGVNESKGCMSFWMQKTLD